MSFSITSFDEVYYSDDDIELLSISEEESFIEISTFITPIKNTNISLSEYNVKELTKDFILNSLQENNEKLEQDNSYRFWGNVSLGTFCVGTGSASLILSIAITSLSILSGLALVSNPIGWIIGGASLVVVGIAGLGYFLYSQSKRLSVEEIANIQQEKERLSTLLNLLKDNEDFRKLLDSLWYDMPFTLDQLMDHAKPFLPQTT